MRQSTLIFCLLLFAGQISSSTATGQKGGLPALALQIVDPTKSESNFSWNQLQSGTAVVFIWNQSDKEPIVSVKISDFNRPEGKDFTEVTAVAADQSASSLKLPKHQITRLVLTMKQPPAENPAPGTYTALLTIQDTKNEFAPYVKQLSIKVSSPQPALTKATIVSWRLLPFFPFWCSSAEVPLKASNYLPKLAGPGRSIGFVQKDTGGFAPVFWTGTKLPTNGKAAIAVIRVEELPHAGKYDGEVSFNSEGDKSGVLNLSVIAKDIVIWPILVIMGGIYISFIAKRYLGVLRSTWTLRMQEAAIGKVFQDAQKRFTEATQGTPYGAFSVAESIAEERSSIVNQLDAIEAAKWSTSLANSGEYAAAITALQALQSQIDVWAQFGPILKLLADTALSAWDALDGGLMIPPTSSPDEPAVLQHARELLVGRVLNGTELDGLRQRVADANGLVQLWAMLNSRARNATGALIRLQSLSGLNDAQRDSLAAVKDQLVAVWKHLWEAEATQDLAAISGGDLDSAEISLARVESGIMELAIERSSSVRTLSLPQHHLTSFNAIVPGSGPDHLPATDDRRLTLLGAAISYGDKGSVALAVVIALLTGLSTYYFGKAFGTIQDYVVLFLWGAGTKATLDIVTSVMDKFSISLNKSTTPI